MNTIDTIPFRRGQGCMNSFIIIDVRQIHGVYTDAFIKAAHELLLQIGDDDVLILRATKRPTSVIMDVLEPDGSFAAFCGNGARVVAAYLESQNGPGQYTLITQETSRVLTAHGNGQYSVAMGQTLFDPQQSSLVANAREYFQNAETLLWSIRFDESPWVTWYFSQTGEPHLITFEDVSHDLLHELGMTINSARYRRLFPQGMSLNVVALVNPKLP